MNITMNYEDEITEQSIISDIIKHHPDNAETLMMAGMHCISCPASRGETLEEACAVHGLDLDLILSQLL
jgi:hydroxylamine reductase